jgi:hypothetical protein
MLSVTPFRQFVREHEAEIGGDAYAAESPVPLPTR